jgi:hypothetical protein
MNAARPGANCRGLGGVGACDAQYVRPDNQGSRLTRELYTTPQVWLEAFK